MMHGRHHGMRSWTWTGIPARLYRSGTTRWTTQGRARDDVVSGRAGQPTYLGAALLPRNALRLRVALDEPRYREHLAWQASFDVAGLFAAGGTVEGFSLTPAEVDQVVRVAVEEVGDRVPVVATTFCPSSP
jgi:hypothetical protein